MKYYKQKIRLHQTDRKGIYMKDIKKEKHHYKTAIYVVADKISYVLANKITYLAFIIMRFIRNVKIYREGDIIEC